ncbi:MAG: hypothetical protein RM368_31610 [Nostoc sp. DedSLP03]|nr:hypothetical protein [Nostoc sp. DedSLP03]
MLHSLSFDVSKTLRLSPVKYCELTFLGGTRVLVEANLTLKGQLKIATIQGFTQARRTGREFA